MPQPVLLPSVRFPAVYIAYAHTVCAYLAFLLALVLGCALHYEKIVENASYGYPDEWFPSVSATIGDRYPERSVFQLLIALTAGPRFFLVGLLFVCLSRSTARSYTMLATGLLRTFTCGGWVYITSTDDHDYHDVFMIAYILLTIPWTVCVTLLTRNQRTKTGRTLVGSAFFATLVPLVYFFIQHKVENVPGAYSRYAYFEWMLVVLDVAFDAFAVSEFGSLEVVVGGPRPSPTISPDHSAKLSHEASSTISPEIFNGSANSPRLAPLARWLAPLAQVVNAFMFFSMLTSLFLCVWHFPLWHMGVSGYELSIVAICSPLLLAVPPLRRLATWYPHLTRVASVLLGLGAYRCESPEARLLTTAGGVALVYVSFVGEVLAARAVSPQAVADYGTTFVVGLLATVVVKYGWFANNPIWPIMNETNGGWNKTGIVVGLVAAVASRVASTLPSDSTVVVASHRAITPFSVLSLGGYLFSVHAMLTDASTLIYWSWEGYPIRGPTPVEHSILTMLAVAVGVLLGRHRRLTSSPAFALVGLAAAYVLYTYIEATSYIGGWVYAVYLAAMAPVVFVGITDNATNAGLIFGGAAFVQMLLSLAHVWVVAYAFVPGGEILRERSDLVLGISTVMVGAVNFRQRVCKEKGASSGVAAVNFRQKVCEEKEASSGAAAPQIRTDVSAPITPNPASPSAGSKKASALGGAPAPCVSLCRFTLTALALLLSLGAFFTYTRLPVTPVPFNAPSRSFTAGIWTIHFGIDNDMWASETRMRDLLMDAQVDIVGLLESDTQRIIMGNRDVTMKLAHDMGYYVDFGPGPHKHTWGAALLSKFPIIHSHHYLLPSPVGELAPAVYATLDVYGEEVDVVVFHSGQEEDDEDRRLQSLAVQRIMGDSQRPLILLSYLVTKPLEGNYNTYVSEESRMRDIDLTDDDRWCEYILFRELRKVGWARISRSTITDTELQIAKFQLVEDANADRDLYANDFIPESEVPQELRFPACFKGDGVRDHRYHVFDEPRYFR